MGQGGSFRLGVDVGGTFTDLVALDEGGRFITAKTPSASRQEAGVLEGIRILAEEYGLLPEEFLSATDLIIHGTTVATNSLLEYNGANTGLLTTKGFRDEIELRRGYKESIFDIRLPQPYQIAPRRQRLGVEERLDYKGDVATPLNEPQAREAIRKLKSLGVASISVCFLFSFVNPSHELRVKDLIEEEYPEAFVSLSYEILPQIREFERVSTTLVNSFVSPKLKAYLKNLDKILRRRGFRGELYIMQSSGGVTEVEQTSKRGVNALLSGPAGGVVAGAYIGARTGYKDVITVDMGGTSYDVCLIEDFTPNIGTEHWVSRYRIAIPMIDIHTIGAGGGSIAWIDEGGALKVGPRSAGAIPGPACYGRGGVEPTVTDADLVLGYLNPDYFLGGKIKLDVNAAKEAIGEKIAKPLNLDPISAAYGIFTIVNSNMSNAIQYVSIKRGHDPRDFALMVFGGAGPVHAGLQAQDLGIRMIIVPKTASTFCALGDLLADLKVTEVRTFIGKSGEIDLERLNDVFEDMLQRAEEKLKKRELLEEVALSRFMDVRYVGEIHEVTVPIRARTKRITPLNLENTFQEFHNLHERLYAYKQPAQPMEVLNLRLDLVGVRSKPRLKELPFEGEDPVGALKMKRPVFFEKFGDYIETNIYDGDRVRPGNLIPGPAVIEEWGTTIVLYPGQEAMLDKYLNFMIEIQA